jgi:hypothetical protein
MTFEELADRVIEIARREPDPTGLGARRIIAGLFEQVARKAEIAERKLILDLIRVGVGDDHEAEVERRSRELDARIARGCRQTDGKIG